MAALIPSASATGSGTMTLAGPSTNSNQTVTIPDATGTMMVSGNMPAFSAYLSSNQSVSTGGDTKVNFDTEIFDTNNNFASNRFTPTVAGYYQINAGLRSTWSSTNEWRIAIYKTGVEYQRGSNWVGLTASYVFGTIASLVYLNGTSDYVEIYFSNNSGSTQTITSGFNPQITYFNGCLVRGA